jgi:phage terminase large subunit-like protein
LTISLPRDENAWLDDLSPAEFEEYERRFQWVGKDARPEQLTPPGAWKTWLLLAGRGFGKTRTAAEDVAAFGLDHPKSQIAVVAETFSDARDVCIEGESGLLSCLAHSSVKHWNRSLGELFLTNGTKYKLFSGDKPNGLRGYQHHRMWWDELAKFIYADEAWTQGQLGLRLGENPQNIVTTTPKPIELIRALVERENVVITAGSTFDNAANLSDTFLEEVRMLYEGTKLGDQELYGKIVLLDGESVFKREHFPRYDASDQSIKNRAVARFVGIDTANTVGETSAYSALVVGEVMRDYTMNVRYVARKKLEFPELVEWVTDEVAPFYFDQRLEAVFIENAASGTQLIQQLRRSGPSWLAHRVVGVKPNRGPNGKEAGWKNAALWARRAMTPLPEPSDAAPWLYDFEKELFAVPNSTYKDQADAYSLLVNQVEASKGAFSSRWRTLMSRSVA